MSPTTGPVGDPSHDWGENTGTTQNRPELGCGQVTPFVYDGIRDDPA